MHRLEHSRWLNSQYASNGSKDWAQSWPNPNGFSTEAEKLIPRFQWKHKGPRTGKTSWKRRTEHSPKFQTYYQTVVTENVWRSQRVRHRSRGQNSEPSHQGSTHSDKGPKWFNTGKIFFSTNGARQRDSHMQKNEGAPTQCYTPRLSKTGLKSKFNNSKYKTSKGKHKRKSLLPWIYDTKSITYTRKNC